MADQDSFTPGNGSGDPNDAPQVAIIAQYLKDLSVESPNAPQVFQWQQQPRLDVQFNINVENAGEDLHEVVIKLEISARSENGVQFLIDLSYGGLFGLRNLPQDALPLFLLVEAPRLLFPFARQIVSDATQNAGYPPLLLEPIDFAAAYMAQMQAQGQQPNLGFAGPTGGNGGGNGGGDGSAEGGQQSDAPETPFGEPKQG